MIISPTYQGKNIGVFGLARSGLAAVHSLVASGANVVAWDDNEDARAAVSMCAENLYDYDFTRLDALMLAPGVPLTHPQPHPLVEKARAFGVPLISDLDIFGQARATLPAHKLVAVTGTNGKSTTTALISHIVSHAGLPSVTGGNIGTGVLALDPLPNGGVYVFELSSFQLDLARAIKADVALLLNITPDHLDRHGTMEAYVGAKKRLFEMQTDDATAVVGVDDQYSRDIATACSQILVEISAESALNEGVSAAGGELIERTPGKTVDAGSIVGVPALRGAHNWQNAAAAYAACRALGIEADAILDAMHCFPGLEHRQEVVPFTDSILVINDSKATNVDSARRALASFERIRWIAGGRAKDNDFSGLSGSLAGVKKAYLMGEAASSIAAVLPKDMPQMAAPNFKEAVRAALTEADAGDTVLLSPACTAFDQFRNFEDRGNAFKAIVTALEGQAS